MMSSVRAVLALSLVASAACAERAADPPRPTPSVSAVECGKAGQGDCPTQRWMKATLQAHLRTRDFGRLEASLTELAKRGPAGYEGWADISRAGPKRRAKPTKQASGRAASNAMINIEPAFAKRAASSSCSERAAPRDYSDAPHRT